MKHSSISNSKPMKHFIVKTLLYSSPVWLIVIYYAVFIQPYTTRDLGKLGQIPFAKNYNLPAPHFDKYAINCTYANTPADSCILIIGDSFSHPDSTTKYSDFLSQWANKLPVYSSSPDDEWEPMDRFIHLSKTQSLPRIIILESVERSFVSRLKNINFSMILHNDTVFTKTDTLSEQTKQHRKKILLEEVQEFAKKRIGIDNPVKTATLSIPMFSCEGKECELYFYQEDIYIPTLSSVCIAKEKLDSLFAYADNLGVHLYVMVAVDKYDLYQPYIINNTYPTSFVLDTIAAMCPYPQFINSKDTLVPMVRHGVKDIFFCNDTHWSQVGGKAVAEQVARRIMTLENDTTLFSIR